MWKCAVCGNENNSFDDHCSKCLSAKLLPIEGKGFGIRAIAYTLDYIVMIFINRVSVFIFGILFGIILSALDKHYSVVATSSSAANSILGFILSIAYFALFEWIYGRSLGKRILGMHVINREGGNCTLKQAATRSVYRAFDGLFFGIIAYNFYMKAPVFQRLGDQKAGTFVVSAKDPIIKNHSSWSKFFLGLLFFSVFSGIAQLMYALLFIRIT